MGAGVLFDFSSLFCFPIFFLLVLSRGLDRSLRSSPRCALFLPLQCTMIPDYEIFRRPASQMLQDHHSLKREASVDRPYVIRQPGLLQEQQDFLHTVLIL